MMVYEPDDTERGVLMGAHRFEAALGSTRCACGSCGGRGYVPDEGAGSRACRDCNSDGHLPTFPDEPAHDLLAEVERLRERVTVDEGRLRAFHRELIAAGYPGAEPVRVGELREQRDALADALEKLQAWIRSSNILQSRPSLVAVMSAADEALRKAGR